MFLPRRGQRHGTNNNGLSSRNRFHRSLRCAPFNFETEQDLKIAIGQNDPGLFLRAAELLSPRLGQYRHAVVMLDAEWEGAPPAEEQRMKIEAALHRAGWPVGSIAAIVVEPEIDAWLWTGKIHTSRALNWESYEELERFLVARRMIEPGEQKPGRPKEAAELALREKGKPRSAAIYRQVAEHASIERNCDEPGLRYLVETMRWWFPAEVGSSGNAQ
ncbi:MAG: methylation-associated defense system protein MAD4 [Rectinemataceae bacterium]